MIADEIIQEVFFKNFQEKRREIEDSKNRFCYYTSAATANLILKSKSIWMRKAAIMNDYLEITYGLDLLINSYNSNPGELLKKALQKSVPGAQNKIEEIFNSWIPIIKNQTYITSLSSHAETDDNFGRLSMWRAYAPENGVAIVMNPGAMLRPSEALGAYTSPVAYLDQTQFNNEITELADRISESSETLSALGEGVITNILFNVFRFAITCTKHPAFVEEQEWRIISTNQLDNNHKLEKSIEVIGGIPQEILKIKLEDHPEEGLYGATPAALIEKVLIGPSNYPEILKSSLSCLMLESGIDNPDSRIHITGIPLRSNQR